MSQRQKYLDAVSFELRIRQTRVKQQSINANCPTTAYSVYADVPTHLKALPRSDDVVGVACLLYLGGQDLVLASTFMEALSFGWQGIEDELREINSYYRLEELVPGHFLRVFRDNLKSDFCAPGYELKPRHFGLLGQIMRCCCTLSKVHIQSGHCGDEAMVAFALALPDCSALRDLRLEGCHIGSVGGVALFQALTEDAPWVEDVSVDDNLLTDDPAGAKMIEFLADNPKSCRRLSINGNFFSDAMVEKFKQVFSKAPRRLDYLSVRWKQKKGKPMSTADMRNETTELRKLRTGQNSNPRNYYDGFF